VATTIELLVKYVQYLTFKSYGNYLGAMTKKVSKSDLCGEPAISIGFRDLGLIHMASFFGYYDFALHVIQAFIESMQV